jgi:hypothetical protein
LTSHLCQERANNGNIASGGKSILGLGSRRVVRLSCHCLHLAYRESHEHCDEHYPREQAFDLRPFERRAAFERNWQNLTARFPNVLARPTWNDGSYHTKITAGRVVLTASSVPSPRSVVREAEFRKTYAQSSQHELFVKNPEPPQDDALLYAILLHGPDVNDLKRPGFMTIAFPNSRCTEYVHAIDLFRKFADVEQAVRTNDVEIIGAELLVRLREVAKTETEGA